MAIIIDLEQNRKRTEIAKTSLIELGQQYPIYNATEFRKIIVSIDPDTNDFFIANDELYDIYITISANKWISAYEGSLNIVLRLLEKEMWARGIADASIKEKVEVFIRLGGI